MGTSPQNRGVIDATQSENEHKYDLALRPKSIDEYIGQTIGIAFLVRTGKVAGQ